MKKKNFDLGLIVAGLMGMLILSVNGIVDSQATDIVSGVIVQIMFAALFVAGYSSYRQD